jgi:hypothetical protein
MIYEGKRFQMAEDESEREFELSEPSRKAVRRLRKQGYELGEQLGEGNFGFVFTVRPPQF